jgi:invasion protein IalB
MSATARTTTTRIVAAAAAALAAGAGRLATPALAQGAPPPALASPGIDAEAFAPGAIRRYSQRHGVWTLRCEEIARLRRRFCDMRADGQGAGFTVSLTVTTSDTGEPAGLLRLPLGVALAAPVTVAVQAESAAPAPTTAKKPARGKTAAPAPKDEATRLRILACEAAGCMTVWPVSRGQLAALAQGRPLVVAFQALKPIPVIASLDPWSQTVALQATIPGEGFAAAVEASTKPAPAPAQ